MIVPEMTPLFPSHDPCLEELSLEVVKESAKLVGRLPEHTAREIRKMLRNVNSYYSNLIEGAYTHLKDIERAVEDDFDDDEKKQKLQRLHKAHIAAQKIMEDELASGDAGDLTTAEMVSRLHKILFDGVPEDFLVQRTKDGQREIRMTPGDFRNYDVIVKNHVPVSPDRIKACMQSFHFSYSLERVPPHNRLIAAAASHHRLLWIHPFLEGNGRVTRLFTDLYLTKGKLDGYGLWTMSRGLSRQEADYKACLASADRKRQGSYDGRGQLSDKELKKFCHFFLEVALDQTRFMRELLSLDAVHKNVEFYMDRRVQGIIPGHAPLPKEAGRIYEYVFNNGSIGKGEIPELLNVSTRKARDIAKKLESEKLLSDGGRRKGPYHVCFPAEAIEYIFPSLVREL